MTKNIDTTRPANPACNACAGTGQDIAFGGTCSECWIDDDRNAIVAARYAGVSTTDADRAYTPGERLDGRTFGRSTTSDAATDKQLRFIESLLADRKSSTAPVIAAARACLDSTMPLAKREASTLIDALKDIAPDAPADGTCANPASAKQIAYIESLISTRDRSDERTNAECETFLMLIETGQMNKPAASASIDLLKKAPQAPVVRRDEKSSLPGLDLRPLEAYTSNGLVRMAIPGVTNNSESSRLKVRIKFARNGSIYVDDAAQYGEGRNYGSQRNGGSYRGDIENHLQAMLDDPHGAVVAYAAITSRCGICNAKLEDKASVERGMGPVCANKF